MVNPFVLTKLDDTTGLVMSYTADNITNVVVDFSTPVAPMPLPQMDDFHNILIKVEGNTTTSNISWKIRDKTTTVLVVGIRLGASQLVSLRAILKRSIKNL